MEAIDQAEFHFSQSAGVAIAVMVGFLVFAVALDLTWVQFRRVLKSPKAPGIGLVAQFLVLPAVAFLGRPPSCRHTQRCDRSLARDLLPGRSIVELPYRRRQGGCGDVD